MPARYDQSSHLSTNRGLLKTCHLFTRKMKKSIIIFRLSNQSRGHFFSPVFLPSLYKDMKYKPEKGFPEKWDWRTGPRHINHIIKWSISWRNWCWRQRHFSWTFWILTNSSNQFMTRKVERVRKRRRMFSVVKAPTRRSWRSLCKRLSGRRNKLKQFSISS